MTYMYLFEILSEIRHNNKKIGEQTTVGDMGLFILDDWCRKPKKEIAKHYDEMFLIVCPQMANLVVFCRPNWRIKCECILTTF